MKQRFTLYLTLCLLIKSMCAGSFAQVRTKAQVIEIPFDFYRNEIVVQVRVNGKGPFHMMVDTGTDPSAIDLVSARELGLKLDPIGRQASGGGTSVNLAYETKLPLVEVGGLTAKNIAAAAIDLSKITERFGKRIHGVLGHSLLSGRIVQIDYPNRVLRFYSHPPFPKAGKESNTAKRTTLSFRYADNVLIQDVTVNGKKIVANLDTGSNGSFQLTPAAVSYLGIAAEVSRAQPSTSVGYNNVAENSQGKVDNVTVGGISVDSPVVLFFGKGTGRDKKPWGLNIGNEFLKDFVVTIDYQKKLITIERP
jgi:predicted aspartyl protease